MSGTALVAVGEGLLEREPELARLGAAIAAAGRGAGAVIHLEGPAGIGKTGLLSAARELADREGLAVLGARGGELERDLAHGIPRGLFERRLVEAGEDERAQLLAGPASLAAPAIGLGGEAGPPGGETGAAVNHGLYWLTANLAARRPLALVVDDVHWADRASLRFLAYLAARARELPVVLLTAARPREPGSDRVLLGQLAAEAGTELIRPGALSRGATASLLAARLGREPEPGFAGSCHAATGGNPFLLRELAGALRADGATGADADASRIRELGPRTVSRSLLLRLTAMPAAAGEIAAAVAVLGNDVELHHAAAFAGVDLGAAALAVDSLADAEILAPQLPLEFVHPIVRSAVYLDLGPGERAAAHGRAAALLVAGGAGADRVAPHLLHAAPAGECRYVELLRAAAAAALSRGAPETAAQYLSRAREESGSAREDPDLLCELGVAEALGGAEPEAASAHLREALARLPDPERRRDAWLALSRTEMSYFGVPGAVAVLEQAVADLAELDEEGRMRLEVELNCLGITHADSFERSAARIDRLPEVEGRTPTERLALCNLAYRVGQRGEDLARTVDLCRRAVAGGALIAAEGTESSAVSQLLYIMYMADLTAEAIEQAEAGLVDATERGSAWGYAAAAGVRGGLAYLAGDVAAAEAECRGALEVPGSPPFAVPFVSAFLSLALVELGELDRAERVLEDSGCGPELPPIVHMELVFWARGRLRLAQGRDAEALTDLSEYGRRCERVGARNPAVPWRGDAALACLRLGRPEEAAALAAEQLRRARAWGTRSALGRTLATQGLLAGGAAGVAALRQAVELLAASPARLDHARALVDLGGLLRRQGRRRDAREPLRAGLDAARRCGATALADRAHEELVTAGARPRRLMFSGAEALTASERRVAALAADGLGNREIAQSLFVTAKTVENHLGRAYAKLGIHSREELPEALSGFGPGA